MELKTIQCTRCGRDVIQSRDTEGRKVHLDPGPSIFYIGAENDSGTPVVKRAKNAYVDHMATCPASRHFREWRPPVSLPANARADIQS